MAFQQPQCLAILFSVFETDSFNQYYVQIINIQFRSHKFSLFNLAAKILSKCKEMYHLFHQNIKHSEDLIILSNGFTFGKHSFSLPCKHTVRDYPILFQKLGSTKPQFSCLKFLNTIRPRCSISGAQTCGTITPTLGFRIQKFSIRSDINLSDCNCLFLFTARNHVNHTKNITGAMA